MNPGGTKEFTLLQNIQTGSDAHSISYAMAQEFRPGLKRPGCENDHSHSSSDEVKNTWSYTATPIHVFVAWKETNLPFSSSSKYNITKVVAIPVVPTLQIK